MDLTSTIQHPESDDVESAIFWRTVRSNEHALPERDLMLAVEGCLAELSQKFA